MAERQEVRKRRPLNDIREVTLNDRWANVARSFAYQPEKDIAIALFERVGQIRRGAVRQFHKVMPDVHRVYREMPAAKLFAQQKMHRGLQQVMTYCIRPSKDCGMFQTICWGAWSTAASARWGRGGGSSDSWTSSAWWSLFGVIVTMVRHRPWRSALPI